MKRTYASIAAELGIVLCPGDGTVFADEQEWTGPDHERGAWDLGIVHWRDRKATPRGLYKFLKLSAAAKGMNFVGQPDWARSYLIHRAMTALARQARVKLPADLSTLERRRVKAMLIDVPPSTPLRKEAFQWSRR